MDVGLFGMEIFIEGGPDNTVTVDSDSEFGGDIIEIGIIPGVSSLVGADEEISPSFHILDKIGNFLGW